MLLITRLLSAARAQSQWLAARLNVKNERGATAVEYGLMLALIAAVIIIAVVFLGQKTSSTFSCTGQSINDKNSAC
jgi:pilus assembly protein Flp/PilA